MATPFRKSIFTSGMLLTSIALASSLQLLPGFEFQAHAADAQVAQLNNDGVKALNSGNFQLAIQKFEAALKIDPSYSYARDNLAIAYNNMALKVDPQTALKYFHKSACLSPTNTTTLQNLDAIISNLGKNPRSFKDRVELGKNARMSGDFDGTIVEYQAALRLQNDPKLHAELGDVLRVRDRLDDAINEYKAALSGAQLDPSDMASTNVKLGQSYQAKKNLKDAIAAFGEAIKYKSDDKDVLEALKTGWEEALRENPQAPENHIGLGQAYQYSNDFGMAEAEYKQALMFDHNNAIARKLLSELGEAKRRAEIAKLINTGVDMQLRKQYDQALAQYVAAVKLDPNNADIYSNIGSALQAKGDFDRALSAFQKALQLQPNNKVAQQGIKAATEEKQSKALTDLTARAAESYKAGRYAEALTSYQELLKQTPNDAGVHFNIAAALQQLGRIDDALAEYKQAVNLDGKNADYKKYLDEAMDKKAAPIIAQAVQAHKDKNYTKAIELYEQAIGLRPKNVDLYFNAASAYYSLQQYERAKADYQKALELDPKGQVNDLWMLATIDEHYNRGYDAMDKLRKYLASAPTGTYVKAAKERLEVLSKNPANTEKIKSEDELNRITQATDAFKEAVKLQQDKQYDQAIPLYEKAMSMQPKESGYPYALSTLYFAKGELDNAQTWLEKALTLDADNKDYLKFKQTLLDQRAEKLVNAGVAKQTAEDFATAIQLYKQALQLVPNNARVWTNLASALYAADDFTGALNAYKKSLELDGNGERVNWYSVAAIDEHYGRGKQALDEYRKFVSINPGDKLQSVAQERIKALAANPADTKPLPTRGEVKVGQAAQAEYEQGVKLQEAKSLDEAIPHYVKAMEINPKESAYPFALGSVYQAKNDADNAAKYYQMAIALDPKNGQYKKYLEAVKVSQAGPLVDSASKKFTAGDYAGAIELYRQALTIIPDDASIHTDIGSAMQASDQFADALKEYETAYRLDPKSQAEVQYFIGALNEHFSRGTESLKNYREYLTKNPTGKFVQYAKDRVAVLGQNPNNVVHLQTTSERANSAQLSALFDEAVKLQGAGKHEEARVKYLDLIGKNGRDASYVYALGTNFQAQGDLANAVSSYEKAIALDPNNADYKKVAQAAKDGMAAQAVQKGGELFAAKDYAGALEQYKQALNTASRQAQANIHTNMAIAYQYMDNFAAARDEYAKGFEMDPKGEVENLYYMGPLDETLGRGAQAFEDYKKYLQYNPSGKYKGPANDRYQVLYFDKTKVNKLQTSQQAAAAQQASQAFNDAVKLQQESKFDEAIAKYQEAIKQNPQSDSVWYSLGTCYQGKGDYDAAISAYEKAIGFNPKEAAYKKVLKDLKAAKADPFLASAYQKQTTKNDKGEYDLSGAITDYLAALRLDDAAGTHLNLATAYQANKMDQKAMDEYLKALQLDPKLHDAHYYLGTIYQALGRVKDAGMEFRKYLQAQPSGQFAGDVKERLKDKRLN